MDFEGHRSAGDLVRRGLRRAQDRPRHPGDRQHPHRPAVRARRWGNRSLLFRDPDGNLVNFFTPVTPAAIEKFAG